jgi:hypothetical protein
MPVYAIVEFHFLTDPPTERVHCNIAKPLGTEVFSKVRFRSTQYT